MYIRFINYNLKYCEDAILNLTDHTVYIIDMVVSRKPGILQEIQKKCMMQCYYRKMIVM